MTDIQFPPEFDQLIKPSGVSAAFVSELSSSNPSHCVNCGGAGTMYVYIATVGPMNVCPDKSRLIAHWADGKWWLGKGYEFPCPVCQSVQKVYMGGWEQQENRVGDEIKKMAEQMRMDQVNP